MNKQHFAIDRKHKRIDTDIPCRLGLPGTQPHDARIVNLSAGGLKLECSHETYQAIIPSEQMTPGTVSGVQVSIKFSLHLPERRAANLQLTAMLVHSERLAQDRYHIGMQFMDMRKQDVSRLENHVHEVVTSRENSGLPAQP